MSRQGIRLSRADRLAVVRPRRMCLQATTIALVGVLMLAGALARVGGQYIGGDNYDLISNTDAGNNYDLIAGPELANSLYAPELEPYELSQSSQRPQAADTIANNWLVGSLLERWLKLQQEAGSDGAELGTFEQQLDSAGGDLAKRQSGSDEATVDRDELFYYYDANTHLPANNPFGGGVSGGDDGADQLSGPVNDPEEFEAKLSQLTDALNHKMSNTQARERLLLSLLNSTAAPAARPVQDSRPSADDQTLGKLQEDELINELAEYLQLKLASSSLSSSTRASSDDGDGDDEDSSELNESLSSATPESRYGGGEYIDHPLALAGHQYVQGGAGEGRQLLGPDGTFENVQVIKTDTAIPSYCDPPNPCPLGYTAKDGCLDKFVNSASFSREYQAKQKCSCDNEHSLFQCAAPQASTKSPGPAGSDRDHFQESSGSQLSSQAGEEGGREEQQGANSGGGDGGDAQLQALVGDDKLSTLARTIQNRFGDLPSVWKLIGEQQQEQGEGGAKNNQDGGQENGDNYLVRSARKWSPEMNLRPIELD